MPNKQRVRYPIRNWSEYNQALVQRGSLTVWFAEDSLSPWYNAERTGRRGSPCTYSSVAITSALTLRAVYRLPFRATKGLMLSLMSLLDLGLEVPDYSTLRRRQKRLAVELGGRLNRVRDIVIDSTGLKVFGEGEWKVRPHGYTKRRTWRKLH